MEIIRDLKKVLNKYKDPMEQYKKNDKLDKLRKYITYDPDDTLLEYMIVNIVCFKDSVGPSNSLLTYLILNHKFRLLDVIIDKYPDVFEINTFAFNEDIYDNKIIKYFIRKAKHMEKNNVDNKVITNYRYYISYVLNIMKNITIINKNMYITDDNYNKYKKIIKYILKINATSLLEKLYIIEKLYKEDFKLYTNPCYLQLNIKYYDYINLTKYIYLYTNHRHFKSFNTYYDEDTSWLKKLRK